ncbi:MAG: hypothetical protein ACI4NP_00610 [Thermoguttaceae bacterium]
MNQNEPMTPSYSWLKKVNDNVFKTEGGEKMRRVKNLFHEMRPAQLTSDWSATGGVYSAKMRFVNQKGAVVGDSFTVYAPQLTEQPTTDATGSRLFVVWRGRWEAVSVGSDDLEDLYVFINSVKEKTEEIITGIRFQINDTSVDIVYDTKKITFLSY